MSIFFLNSTDRVYNDKELNAVSKILFSNGVLNTTQATRALWKLAGDFLVEPAGGSLNVTAKPGLASVEVASQGVQQQVIIQEENELSASVASNVSLANRNDAVVLRIDQSIITDDDLNAAGSNAVSLVVISGNSANALSDTEIAVALSGDPYIRLANILVPLNATEITSGMITDVRSMAKMTHSAKFSSDTFGFFALENDPEDLEAGDVWYNSTQGILKMYNGTNTIALQTQAFDWGYYPPNGIDQQLERFDPVAENDAEEGGVTSYSIYKGYDLSGATSFTLMAGDVIAMPDIENPYVRIKMGNPSYPADISIKVCAVDGSNNPTSVLETINISKSSIPNNEYIGFYLDGSLYTAGTNYMIVVLSNQTGFLNGAESAFVTHEVQLSSYEADDVFIISKQGSSSVSNTTDPVGLTWGTANTDRHFIMEISEREEIAIGLTDATTNLHKISQAFSPKSKDMTGFVVTKGEDVGVPTGDISASLYRADENDEPTGNVIATGILTNAEWAAISAGETAIFPLAYDELVVGENYVVVIDTDDYSDDNNYSVYFGTSVTGRARYFNTADGWTSLNGDLFFGIRTSKVRKIVVTDDTGKIDPDLLPVVPKRVTYITSAAVPAFSVDTTDAVCITALAEAITSMTTNKIGTPHDFQRLIIRFKDNGTIRAIAWGADYVAAGATLPTTTTANKVTTVTLEYDEARAKWGCIAAVTEA